jgi:hypothetical protein
MKSPQLIFDELLPVLTAVIVAAGGVVEAPAASAAVTVDKIPVCCVCCEWGVAVHNAGWLIEGTET